MTSSTGRADRRRELRRFVDEARRMQGWTFAYEPVPLGAPAPWDYKAQAAELVRDAADMLDMGTGGGEVLERILVGYAGRAYATEAWRPNVDVARRRLQEHNVAVIEASNLALPFRAASFDVVLNRHEELTPADVARVLRPGGRVLTQQVHPDYHAELRTFFPRMTVFEPHDVTYPAGFGAAGLEVVTWQQHRRQVAYRELGHLVYFLVVASWTVPDFDLDNDLEALSVVEQALGGPDGIVLSDPRYVLEARKPG